MRRTVTAKTLHNRHLNSCDAASNIEKDGQQKYLDPNSQKKQYTQKKKKKKRLTRRTREKNHLIGLFLLVNNWSGIYCFVFSSFKSTQLKRFTDFERVIAIKKTPSGARSLLKNLAEGRSTKTNVIQLTTIHFIHQTISTFAEFSKVSFFFFFSFWNGMKSFRAVYRGISHESLVFSWYYI